jgi:hypothetical protein
LITFENDPIGAIPNGYVSTDQSRIAFNYLSAEIGNFGLASDGNAIKSLYQGPTSSFSNSGLVITTRPTPFNNGSMNEISFSFGNDDSNLFEPGDQALMRVLQGGEILGQVSVALNGNGAMDQTILFSGFEFSRVEFAYVDSYFRPIQGMLEVIDNINLKFSSDTGSKGHSVPDSTNTAVLLATSVLGTLLFSKKRRRQSQKT